LVPLGLQTKWSLSRNWDFDFEYRYTAIGAKNGFVENLFFGDLKYTW
jgi:opacity protein-like surface antigen